MPELVEMRFRRGRFALAQLWAKHAKAPEAAHHAKKDPEARFGEQRAFDKQMAALTQMVGGLIR